MSAAAPCRERISVRRVVDPTTSQGRRLGHLAPLLDRVLGIHAIDRFCARYELFGLAPQTFAQRALEALRITVVGTDRLSEQVPRSGPVIVAANHPHGGIEGLILLAHLAALRSDVKIMANTALRVFAELHDSSIFVNPLVPESPLNRQGMRRCLTHLRDGGALVVFPAGRTAFHQPDLGYIADSPWHSCVARLALGARAPIVPVRFTGLNSPWFYRLGRLWYRFRLLLLARELLNKVGQHIEFHTGAPIRLEPIEHIGPDALTAYLQAQCASLRAATPVAPPSPAPTPLGTSAPRDTLAHELRELPQELRLLRSRHIDVFLVRGDQAPALLQEVTRERERTYRRENEGSGQPYDTDAFDDHLHHLVAWDNERGRVLGAYRMGDRRHLRETVGSTYLDRLFCLEHTPIAQGRALELGRSFVAPEYQRSPAALDVLWRGIGIFLQRHPAFDMLYGTVSISRDYDATAVAMIGDVLIDQAANTRVRSRFPLAHPLPGEWSRFKASQPLDVRLLDKLIRARHRTGKGLPTLIRHYDALRAHYLALAVDPHFAHTPGLLLSVPLATLPPAKRRRYLWPTPSTTPEDATALSALGEDRSARALRR